jgi:hypothetical protein
VIKIKTDEMGGAGSMYRMKGFWWANQKEKKQKDDDTTKIERKFDIHGTDSLGSGYIHTSGKRK